MTAAAALGPTGLGVPILIDVIPSVVWTMLASPMMLMLLTLLGSKDVIAAVLPTPMSVALLGDLLVLFVVSFLLPDTDGRFGGGRSGMKSALLTMHTAFPTPRDV